MNNLLIVESPAKCKKIENFLGPGYVVLASFGHLTTLKSLKDIDISKLPADVRKKFKQLQVLHAERKIQNKAKSDFLSFVK